MLDGFVDFLKEWGVVGLAVAVIVGGKLNEWVSALVDDIMMPLIGLVLPGGAWREWVVMLDGENALLLGHFLGATLDFLIVAMVVYLFFTRIIKSEEAIAALESEQE